METLTKEVELKKEVKTQTETQTKTEIASENKEREVKEKQTSIFNALRESKKEETLPLSNDEKVAQKSAYLQSFENKTVADIMEEKRKKEAEEFAIEKEKLIEQQYEKKQESVYVQEEVQTLKETPKEENSFSEKTIEKPNFDLLEENKKVVKLFKQSSQKKKSAKSKKAAGLALACALAGCGIVCVANTVIIDNMNKSLLQIDETYNLNLQKYLKEITKLDQTNKSLEFLETYPEDLLDAGDLGQKSNWFDKLCNFFGGMFGG